MARLIDADALLDRKFIRDGNTIFCKKISAVDIDEAPTVDAVPVVRCKDCIHRDDGSCPMDENYPWHDTKSDDYCSYGERRCENEPD